MKLLFGVVIKARVDTYKRPGADALGLKIKSLIAGFSQYIKKII